MGSASRCTVLRHALYRVPLPLGESRSTSGDFRRWLAACCKPPAKITALPEKEGSSLARFETSTRHPLKQLARGSFQTTEDSLSCSRYANAWAKQRPAKSVRSTARERYLPTLIQVLRAKCPKAFYFRYQCF
jgi:hypothetical protein